MIWWCGYVTWHRPCHSTWHPRVLLHQIGNISCMHIGTRPCTAVMFGYIKTSWPTHSLLYARCKAILFVSYALVTVKISVFNCSTNNDSTNCTVPFKNASDLVMRCNCIWNVIPYYFSHLIASFCCTKDSLLLGPLLTQRYCVKYSSVPRNQR